MKVKWGAIYVNPGVLPSPLSPVTSSPLPKSPQLRSTCVGSGHKELNETFTWVTLKATEGYNLLLYLIYTSFSCFSFSLFLLPPLLLPETGKMKQCCALFLSEPHKDGFWIPNYSTLSISRQFQMKSYEQLSFIITVGSKQWPLSKKQFRTWTDILG
jgi:hypothetical protein